MTRREIVSFLRKPAFIRDISGRFRHWARRVSRRMLWLLAALPLFGALAATFTQINWSGGIPADATACGTVGGQWTGSECAAADPANQIGWTAYSSKDATIVLANGGADLQLGTVSDSRTHTSDIDFALSKNTSRTYNSDQDFSYGATLSGVSIRSGMVRLRFATHTPSWIANTAWNTANYLYNMGGGTNNLVKPALADLDNDGDFDMLVGANNGILYAYQNTGSATTPAWTQQNSWVTPSIGSYASPTFGDLDGDGDLDILIGEYNGGMYGYENSGTKNVPIWSAKPAWNIPDTALGFHASPTLADLDGDGDLDLMAGEYGGISYGYRNDGTATMPVWIANAAWNTPDTGAYAVPALADIDGDGDFDLLIGNNSGGIVYGYQNTGSLAAPLWTANTAWNKSGLGSYSAAALADLDADGDLDFMMGQSDFWGYTYGYINSGTSTYTSSGTLTSAAIDTVSNQGFTTLTYSAAVPANTTLSIDVRAGNTAVPDGTWTAWQNNIATGGDISALGTRRYAQYRANFATTDTAVTASLAALTINYTNYAMGANAEVTGSGSAASVGLKLNFSPSTVGTLVTSYLASNIHVAGNYAYVTDNSGTSASVQRIINISNPAAPVQVAATSHSTLVLDTFVSGNYAYVAIADAGLAIVDISNPAAPVTRSTYNTPSWAQHVQVIGSYAYVADWLDGGLQIINVSNPNAPTFVGGYNSPGTAERIFVSGNIAYLADGTSGLAIFDISNPAAPVLLTTYPGTTSGVYIVGNYAYVTGSGFKILNVSNPAAPVLVGGSSDVAVGGDIYVNEGYAYIADTSLKVINVSDPASPTLVASHESGVYGVFPVGRYAYLAASDFKVVALGNYAASGVFTSSVIDAGPHVGYTTLGYTATTPAGTAITLDARAGNTPNPDGSWTAWQTGVANGGNIAALGVNRYAQYRVNLSTSDGTVTPLLQDITFNYSRYAYTAALVSSAYNSASLNNLFDELAWTQTLPAGTEVRIQIQTAPNNAGVPGVWGTWVGPDSTAGSYWSSANTFSGGCSGAATVTCVTLANFLRDSLNDQWLQYKVILVSDGSATPTLAGIGLTYATSGSGNISVSPTSGLTTTEAGGTATFNVVLTSAPTANVSFNLYSSDTTEATVSPASLTFTSANWGTPQIVTVTGLDDLVDDDNIAYSIVTTVASSADLAFNHVNPGDVALINTDNDTAGIIVSPTSGLVTTEVGGTATFTVRLNTQPVADVTLGISGSDTSEGAVSSTALTFNSTNWNTAQTIIVTGVNDVVVDGNIAYTASTAAATSADPKYSGMNASDVTITNNDNDVADIIVTAASGYVTNESGGFAPITVALTSQPSAPVTIMFSTSDSTEGFVSPSSMDFDASNWNVPQTGTVFGINDAVVDGNINYSIVTSAFTSADANFNGVNPADIAMSNLDNDGYTITVMPGSGLVTTEDGGQVTFTLSLGAAPSANVTINLSSSDLGEGVPSPSSITFYPGGSRSVQFTVNGIDDRLIDGAQNYSVVTAAAVSTDPNYNGVNAADVALINNDNEFSTIQLERNVASAQLGTMVSTADVNCDARPDLIVGANRNPGEVYVYYGSATGYASTPSWYAQDTTTSTGFGNRVAGIGDLNGDGCDEIAISAPSYNSNTGAVYIFYGSAGGLPDANGDGKGVPSDAAWRVYGNQTWSAFGSGITSGDFDGNGYRDLAVAAPDYDVDQADEGRIYVFFNSAAGLPATAGVGTAQLSDAGWMFESDYISSGMGWFRGLATANVNGDAYADLIIGIRNQANGQGYEGRVYVFYGSAAGFNDAGGDKIAHPSDANWKAESDNANSYFGMSVANAGRVNGDSYDDIIVGAYQYTNGQTYEGAAFVFHGSATGLRTASTGDGIVRAATESDRVLEGNIAYDQLGDQVSGAGDVNNDGFDDVIVAASYYNTTRGAAFIYFGSATGVVATPGWSSVYQGSDLYPNFGGDVGKIGDVNGDGRVDLYIAASAIDSGQINEGAVFVLLSAVQTPGFTVAPTSGLITSESGGTATFTVALTSPPTTTVTINISSDNTVEGTVSPASLVFDQTTWRQAQTVTVTGVNDGVADGIVAYTLQLAPAVSADSAYSGLNPVDVSAANLDNDVPQVVTVTGISTSEIGAGSVTLTRSGEITANLTVNYSLSGTAVAGVDYAALSGSAVIPTGSASVTVSVIPINDSIAKGNRTVIATVNNGGGYTAGAPGSATVTITDDDVASVSVFPASGLVTSETGKTDNFSVMLGSQPSANVTINLSSADTTEGAVIVSTLTFTPSNWSVAQTVTLVGVNDALVDGNVAYTLTTAAAVSADAQYNGMAVADVAAVNLDDDSLAKVQVIATQARVLESSISPGIFTVSRSGSTAAALTVFYSVNGTAARSVDYFTLTGTVTIPAGSSSTSITVGAIQDAIIEADETIIVTLAGASDYLVDQPGAATVVITDDDQPRIPVVNFTLDQTAAEGATVTVTAVLSEAASAYPVTLPYTVSGTATNPGDHNAASGSIVINSGTLGTATFNIVSDAVAEPAETVVFTMGTPVNAATGTKTAHTVTIQESNGSPKVLLNAAQGGTDARLIVTANGQVTVTASVTDPNPSDTHSYNWSASNAALLDINDGNPATFVFSPAALTSGFYNVRLTVTDNGAPALSTTVEMLLQVAYSAPVLSNAVDSDNDGITDDIESYKDDDSDGIPDYLDIVTLDNNELALMPATGGYLMRTDPGLLLRLGDVAFAAGADGAKVTVAEIAAYGGGEGNAGSAAAQDTVPNSGGYFDFEIAQLPQAGQSVRVVIPQLAPIPSGARYRKYDPVSGWRDFVADANNALASAPGAPGECPLPGDPAYTPGLTAGHYCIQLTLQDGGPNDTDGLTNHVIEDPGQLALVEGSTPTAPSTPGATPASASASASGGGGAVDSVFLLYLVAMIIGIRRVHQGKIRVDSRLPARYD
jgi:hypothetical protein